MLVAGSCRRSSRLLFQRKAAASREDERGPTCSAAPGTTAGISAGLLPRPEGVQLLASVLGGRQHVQVALLLTEPAGVLTEGDGGRQQAASKDGRTSDELRSSSSSLVLVPDTSAVRQRPSKSPCSRLRPASKRSGQVTTHLRPGLPPAPHLQKAGSTW